MVQSQLLLNYEMDTLTTESRELDLIRVMVSRSLGKY